MEIQKITTKKELKKFIKFPFNLYKGNPYYVPPLVDFELSTLLEEKNPAFDHCEAAYWVVLKDNEIVGRIAAIVLNGELKEKSLARFGWVDFIDDLEVSKLLFETAKKWAEQKGANALHGPMGFTDLDFEGALVSGFDQLATQATIYNYPYYIDHFNSWGLVVSATWVEVRLKPKELPRKIKRASSMVSSRFGLKVKKFNKTKDILKYAPGVFKVLNEAYSDLYGFQQLSAKQIDYYIDQYFGFIRKEYVCIIVNEEDEVVGFALTLPSLSKAFQKAKGSLYPFGFLHVLKSFYFNKHIDLFLIGVKPSYQKLGANVLIFEDLFNTAKKNNVNYVSTGPMLADNNNVLNLWNDFELDPVKIKRSCFRKDF